MALQAKQNTKIGGKPQTDLCEECQVRESVEHVIMVCRKYKAYREVIRAELRESGMQEISLLRLLNKGEVAQIRALFTFLMGIFFQGFDC